MSTPYPDIQMSKEMAEKLATVDFGLQVQAFLKTRIGVYLTQRAQDEVEDFTQRLKAHPILQDPAGAAHLQTEVKAREMFLYWMADAIRTGSQLMEQMIAEERQALGIDDDNANSGDATGS